MPLFDHFDFLAPYYDRFIPVPETSTLEDLLELPDSARLLDAGGGTGRIAQKFSEVTSEIVIVDLSMSMLLQAATKGISLGVCSETEALPFRDASFDRIIMVDALHHVVDHNRSASECWRVLKPGGRLVIEEPDIRTFIIKLVALAEKLAFMRSHFIPPNRIATLFPFDSARVNVIREGYNAWVVIDKTNDLHYV